MVLIWIICKIHLAVRANTGHRLYIHVDPQKKKEAELMNYVRFTFEHRQYRRSYCDINRPMSSVILKPHQYCRLSTRHYHKKDGYIPIDRGRRTDFHFT